MTAIIHTQTAVDTPDVDVVAEVEALLVGLDEFLRDPIGYGDYDFADPISLSEFSSHRHMHDRFVAVLT